LGGWIVLHLISRGEDPRYIRVLDINPPLRKDLLSGPAQDVHYIMADIANEADVRAAFAAPWPSKEAAGAPLTVFHTASIIRFYERHPDLLHRSQRVNVDGTRFLLAAARAAGASVFVYTSSGSVAVRQSRYLLWPWEKRPKYFVQVLSDDDTLTPKQHADFFSNYAYTKMEAETLVRRADKSRCDDGGLMRTGCIRPGNGT
jgi:nucleoside-diphosphate-sugar epimerase